MRNRIRPVADYLYRLIPEVYRSRDFEVGTPLYGLIEVIAEQYLLVEENLNELYDDQFIDTCAEWAVPYIGELIGCAPLHGGEYGVASRRAEVANAIRYRRRKGTSAMLRGLATDVTGWGIEVEERAHALATYHSPEHVLSSGAAHPDVRRRGGTLPKRADVRRIADGYGGYGLAAVAIRVWRTHAYPADDVAAVPSRSREQRQFLFHPAGVDTPLFSNEEDGIARPIGPARMRTNLAGFIGAGKAVNIKVEGRYLEPDELHVADLGGHEQAAWSHRTSRKHLIDPARGRMLLAKAAAEPPIVTFSYGFTADIGGGPYDRGAAGDRSPAKRISAGADSFTKPLRIDESQTLEVPSDRRIEGRVEIELAADRRLELRSARSAPAVFAGGEFAIVGAGTAEITLSGLLVVGTTLRVRGAAALLRISDCTFTVGPAKIPAGPRPLAPSIFIGPGIESVEIERTLLSRIECDRDTRIHIVDSIVDAGTEHHIAIGGSGDRPAAGTLTLLRSTVVGQIRVAEIKTVADSIVSGLVGVERRVHGMVRFSYLPAASRVPERFECVTDADEGGMLRPHFKSRRYGDPAYFRLADYCSQRIRHGAEDESEMGAYHDSSWSILDARLRQSVAQSLPFHVEAGFIYAS